MKITITSDSVCDLSKKQIEQNDIKIIPLTITFGEQQFLDGVDINAEKIFEIYKKNKQLPKTSAINEYQYTEFFEKNLKNCDALIHFNISDKLSSCHQNACAAAKNFKNVFVVNSENLSTGVGLLVLYAAQLRDENLSAEKIYEKVKEKISKVQASFVIERLDYLYKGGRCSALAMFSANLLKIRPSIAVKDGKMGVDRKYRGKMDVVVANYIKDVLKTYPDREDDLCFITYSSANKEMLESAHKTLKENANFKQIVETSAGATITSHCGENTLGILFFTK